MTVQHPIAWSMCVPGQHVWVLITQVSKRHCCEVLASGGMVVVMSWWLTRWPWWSFPASVILWFSDSVMILWFYDVLGQTWHNPVLAQHWFKAFGRKHSESLSLLLWKNYAGTIIPSMIFFFFFGNYCTFTKSLLPVPNTSPYAWYTKCDESWGLESNALIGMRKVCQAAESVPSGQHSVAIKIYLFLQMRLCTEHDMPLVCTMLV